MLGWRRRGAGPLGGRHPVVLGSLALALLLAAAGCALQRNVVQQSVGRATRFDVLNKVEGILNREGYTVQERRDTGALILLATSWQTRQPLDDEARQGITECRTRLLIEGRPQGNDMFSVVLRAETTGTVGGDGVWKPLPATDEFRARVRELAGALALEIDAGMRTR